MTSVEAASRRVDDVVAGASPAGNDFANGLAVTAALSVGGAGAVAWIPDCSFALL
ncbi:MAG TPA: hypothetical protein VJ464_14090 [Blastocatellia bacterium]|nr:hypothetical protein [Blastocatellia bacterium]